MAQQGDHPVYKSSLYAGTCVMLFVRFGFHPFQSKRINLTFLLPFRTGAVDAAMKESWLLDLRNRGGPSSHVSRRSGCGEFGRPSGKFENAEAGMASLVSTSVSKVGKGGKGSRKKLSAVIAVFAQMISWSWWWGNGGGDGEGVGRGNVRFRR